MPRRLTRNMRLTDYRDRSRFRQKVKDVRLFETEFHGTYGTAPAAHGRFRE